MAEMLLNAGSILLAAFAIFGIAGIAVGVFSHWGQIGILVSTKALEPKFDRLNPAQGVKNIFSKKKLLELLISLLKAILIGLIVFIWVKDQLPAIIALSNGTPKESYLGFVALLHLIFRITCVATLFLGVMDFAMQKKMHIKSLMMSMDEIKREYRESEGDPMVKGQRRQLARELAESGPVANTASADAVVVNPTHFAVAMRYDRERTGVPMILAKGKNETARAMIERAHELQIPVIRHVWLARTLYATGHENKVIPRSSYEAVAHVYAVIRELKDSLTERIVELETFGDPPSAE